MKTPVKQVISLLFFLLLTPFSAHALSTQEQAFILNQTANNLLSQIYSIQPATEDPPPLLLSFSDVGSHAWYREAAEFVVDQQIMSGTSSTEFSPDSPLTRGLLTTVITNAEKADFGLYPNTFPDLTYSWYRDSANWCAQNNIMAGYSPDFFAGTASVTREQLAVVLFRYGQYRSLNPSGTLSNIQKYSDYTAIPSYAKEAYAWCVQENLLFPSQEKLRPNDTATRAEIAYGMMNLMALF